MAKLLGSGDVEITAPTRSFARPSHRHTATTAQPAQVGKGSWYAVGDVDGVRALVESIVSIGKKRAIGEGHVLRWEVEPAPELDEYAGGHLHPDGTLGRPCPAACRARAGADVLDGGRGRAGIRPPYMHPARAHQLVLPALLSS